MTAAPLRRLWLLTGVLALAFVLRVVDLGAVPLRGDEAFAVRYWADNPARSLSFMLDLAEPPPFGTYLTFWAWKSLVGQSEFAMRVLPLLGSLLGAAATAAVARYLFGTARRSARESVALLAALLWAANAFQIWHAQDVRNYALWAGLSPLAMWLFLRLVDAPPRRRIFGIWMSYVLVQVLALHMFFLEAFMLVVQAAYLVGFRRPTSVPPRTAFRRAISAWGLVALPMIPWAWQLWRIAQVGYAGNTEPAAPLRLLTRFLPTLLAGPESSTWPAPLALGWLLLLSATLWVFRRKDRRVAWLAVWVTVPVALLFLAATRTNVFHPRYVIAAASPLLILLAAALESAFSAGVGGRRVIFAAVGVGLLIAPTVGLANLASYYRHVDPKSPDWPALVTYLDNRIPPTGPHLVLQTMPDPAFAYYYRGHAAEKTLVAGESIPGQLFSDTLYFRSIWLLGRSPEAEAFLADHMQLVSQHTLPDFTITQYRPWKPQPDEFVTPVDAVFGDVVRLQGVTVQGPDSASRAIAVLLYWEPLTQTQSAYKVFVHLLGPTNPNTGTPLWDQDDAEPLDGFARTTGWQVGALLRDPYALLDDPASQRQPFVPGTYQIAVGLYDPVTNTRLQAVDATGEPLGDSVTLATITLP